MEQPSNKSPLEQREEEMFAGLPELTEAGDRKRNIFELTSGLAKVEKGDA